MLYGETSSLKRDLSRKVAGSVLVPSDANFGRMRTSMWNARVENRTPACIVKAADTDDVAATIRFARQQGFRVSIRSGGHNWYSSSLRNGSILLDISALEQVSIDSEKRLASVMPGVSAAELIHRAGKHQMVFPVAHCGSVPLSGYLLNGGWGWNCNEWGVACAHINSIEMITATGEKIRTSIEEEPELFWAARGIGPAMFAAATRFELELLDLPDEIRLTSYYIPISALPEVCDILDNIAADIPKNVELPVVLAATPPQMELGSSHMILITAAVFAKSEEHAKKSLQFLHGSGLRNLSVIREEFKPIDLLGLLEITNRAFPPRARYLGENIWTDQKLTASVPGLAEHMSVAPSSRSNFYMLILPEDKDELPDAAVSMQAQTLMMWYSIWEDPGEDGIHEAWFETLGSLLQPFAKGRYIGETNLHNEGYAEASFSKANWLKLQELRKKYDPDTLFYDFLK